MDSEFQQEQQDQLNELIAEATDLQGRLELNQILQAHLKVNMWVVKHGARENDTVIFPNGRRTRIASTSPSIIVKPVTRTGKIINTAIRLHPDSLEGFSVQHNYSSKPLKNNNGK
jgi:hypothetical protein